MAKTDTLSSLIVAAAAVAMAVTYMARSPGSQTRTVAPVYVNEWKALADSGSIIGDAAATIKIISFSDFECPFCATFSNTLRATRQRYGSSIAVVLFHTPIAGHKHAVSAARAADCAKRAGRFDQMVEVLFMKRDSLGIKPWSGFAREAGITDSQAFAGCIRTTAPFSQLDRDTATGRRLRVLGTPTVIVNGWRFSGTPDSVTLWRAIDSLLASRSPFPTKKRFGII
ncbi:MAG: thioredoxin domain-containing protein [Gemmatimonadota bacterium]|nr:thioredoxin domain-containing protein [Gemmatimonadota bacterium]